MVVDLTEDGEEDGEEDGRVSKLRVELASVESKIDGVRKKISALRVRHSIRTCEYSGALLTLLQSQSLYILNHIEYLNVMHWYVTFYALLPVSQVVVNELLQ